MEVKIKNANIKAAVTNGVGYFYFVNCSCEKCFCSLLQMYVYTYGKAFFKLLSPKVAKPGHYLMYMCMSEYAPGKK